MTTLDSPAQTTPPVAPKVSSGRRQRRLNRTKNNYRTQRLATGQRTLLYAIAIAAVGAYVFPLLFLLNTALKTSEEFVADPIGPTQSFAIGNFVEAWEAGNFGAYFFNSLLYTLVAGVISTVAALLLAFPVARGYLAGSKAFWPAFFVVSLFLPNALTAQFQLMLELDLYGSRLGYILLQGASLGIGPLLIMGYLRSLPRELDEAAAIDGCGYFRYLLTFIVPLARPVIITVFVLQCIGTWNDIILATIYLADPAKYPVTVGLFAFKGQYSNDWALLAAAVLLVAIPLILLYAFVQKYIIAGVTDGALKS
ncbi:carbohydrate ABC transporter permease [Microbacterium chocolatum]|uniref:carbohydrate ABC transporter permease n=1 Tax=Microbacterium aurantiacum TaxID=162393 RepID=UPI00338E534F